MRCMSYGRHDCTDDLRATLTAMALALRLAEFIDRGNLLAKT
jgi:hypothetical protein